MKRTEKSSDTDIRRGTESAPIPSLSGGIIYFLIGFYNKSKECLKVVKIVLDPLPSFVAQLIKNLPAKQETWVRSLGWEDPLEKGKATHSSILA